MKRITSIVLAFLMLISIIPSNLAYAQEGQKLDVVLLRNGRYMIKLPGVDYTRPRQATELPDINPTDNPEAFMSRTVRVDIDDLVLKATGMKTLTVIVESGDIGQYSKSYKLTVEEARKGIKVPVPREKYWPAINAVFDDGRDARYAVEAHAVPSGPVTVNIGFMSHTGVATRWHGSAAKPDVEGNYLGINKTPHKFDLPKVDQNSILKEGNDPWSWKDHPNTVNLSKVPWAHIKCGDEVTAKTCQLVIEDKLQGQLAQSKYYFHITGDALIGFTATMREKNTVDFEAGDGAWKTSKPAQQFAANGLKLSDIFMEAPDTIGPVTVPNGETDLTPPAVEAGKPAKKFVGWSTTKNGPAVDMATYVVTGDVTFYALYAEEEQGKVKVEYKDSKTNAAIDSKYKLKGQDYPVEKTGDMDKAIKDEVFVKDKAPKFLGYKIKSITTDPVPNPPATANYTKNGDYTVIYTYDKLDDIIPEKKNGQDNPDVTPEVKEHYAKVTYQVAAADNSKAKLQLDDADATSPLVYYVNPLEGKHIKDVADVKALSKDDNLYKVDANDMWTFKPESINSTDQEIMQARDSEDNVVKTEITLTAKVADKTAAKFVGKLAPQDIKVWVGDTIDWKKGIAKLDDATLQEILDKPETQVTDESNRSSANANLPNGEQGNLKVTFEDGSSLVVNDQMLYVAPKKNDNNKNLPDDAVQVDFKIGEGVNGVAKTKYVQPGTNVQEDAPAVSAKAGFKDAKWYKGEADSTTEATGADYNVTEKAVFTAKATGKDKVVKLDDPKNPTNFPKDPTDNNKNDADYVTVTFVADANGKIKEGGAVKEKGIAYAVLKNTTWANAVKGGVVVPTEFEGKDKFYTFKEWQKDGTKVTKFADVGETDVTYTAVFGKADEYSVTYNLNAPTGLTVGGSAPVDNEKHLMNENVKVKALDAANVLKGYEFKGWNEKADGTGKAYAVDSEFAITKDTTLYAQWNKTVPDVIPVNDKDDDKGTDGNDIPDNYVYVEFRLKDAVTVGGDKKDNELFDLKGQAKFKVDPTKAPKLTPPTFVAKPDVTGFKAAFNKADYENKIFTAKENYIEANVRKLGNINVTYKFVSGTPGETLPTANDFPKAPEATTAVEEDQVNVPAQPNPSTYEVKDTKGDKLGDWVFRGWEPSTNQKAGTNDIEFVGTWDFVKPNQGRTGGFFFFPAAEEEKPETAIHKAYIFGYEDDSFKPGGNMTRAEAAAMLARLQGLDLSNDARPDFMDVRSGWYNGSINAVVNAGYMKGYPDNTFRPNGKITRAEFAQMIKAIDKANTGVAPFADVKGHWAEAAINQAYANGRIAGYPDSTFRPNNNITRAEAVTVFNKLYDRSVDEAGLVNVKNSLVDFNDISRGHWAYDQVVEASNTHEYYRTKKGEVAETWVKIIQTWKDILAHR